MQTTHQTAAAINKKPLAPIKHFDTRWDSFKKVASRFKCLEQFFRQVDPVSMFDKEPVKQQEWITDINLAVAATSYR